MTETTKEVFEKYQVRKTKEQKSAFISFVQKKAGRLGFTSKIEASSTGACNIVVGDVERAKVVYGAHYDTCPRLPFPNFITPKNFFIYLLYQIVLVVVIVGVMLGSMFLADLVLGKFESLAVLESLVQLAIYFGFIFLMLAGPANKHTANDNTSGVTTLLDIMAKLPNEYKNDVAFVFFDLEEVGMIGSAAFAKKYKKIMKNKLLINFDCVSDGEDMLFVLRKKAKAHKQILEEAFVSNEQVKVEVATKGVFYPSDQMMFPCGVGVAALKRSKFMNILYMDRIHTNKDTVYREENIEFLAEGSIKLLELI